MEITLQVSMTQLSAVVPFVDSKLAVSKPCNQASIQKLIGWSGKPIISKFCQSKLHTCPSFEVADSKIAQKSEICEDGKWRYEDGKG